MGIKGTKGGRRRSEIKWERVRKRWGEEVEERNELKIERNTEGRKGGKGEDRECKETKTNGGGGGGG